MGQTGSYVEHEHDPFIKQINYANPNMTRTYLVSIHDLFIDKIVEFVNRIRFYYPWFNSPLRLHKRMNLPSLVTSNNSTLDQPKSQKEKLRAIIVY